MKKMAALAFALIVSTSVVPAASAAVISFDLDIEFSGATPPAGTAPWLRISFDDFGGSGSVQVTMEAIGLTGDEFVSGWYFNFDPTLNAAAHLPTPVANPNVGWDSISAGNNAFKADGDGFYDFLVSFADAPVSDRFQGGESLVLNITGVGLTASSFDYLSAPAGGHGPFHTAAHVQGIGTGGQLSGWIANSVGSRDVPEPTTLTLVLLGLAFGAARMRKKP
ncbi:MAG TPA: PEP-CTERM sorting domain-containing protein [Rhodothermia bacterium]|nr:PEP-CTERM sorting domain-containing protein [Rhodothermia bacterium]